MENLLNNIRRSRSFTKLDREQPGRLPGMRPVAIVDIGSNSVRLVVYEGPIRTPTQLFNEKEMLELGQSVAETGRIDEAAIEETCKVLQRFRLLCKEMRVAKIYPIATAAARDGANGEDFIKRASKALGAPIQLISGEEEARLAALGVISGFWHADGIVGDMGGGSLELLPVANNQPQTGVTLPLGGLKLKNSAGNNVKTAKKLAGQEVRTVAFLKKGKGKPFYAVGGTWRSIAHLHMLETNYPLSVIHDYRVSAADFLPFLQKLQLEFDGDKKVEGVSSRRRPLIPYGAALLEAVLEATGASEVVFSANGVREGVLYDNLPEEVRGEDPLISAARDLCFLRARSPQYAHEFWGWSHKVFGQKFLAETENEARLRKAACYLSDIGWRAHPDYRGEQSFSTLLNAALSGTDHQGRGYLAYVNLIRYAGTGVDVPSNIAPLLTERSKFLAQLIAALMRLAYVISASMPGALEKVDLKITETDVCLILPRSMAALNSRRLESRFATFAKHLGKEPSIKILK